MLRGIVALLTKRPPALAKTCSPNGTDSGDTDCACLLCLAALPLSPVACSLSLRLELAVGQHRLIQTGSGLACLSLPASWSNLILSLVVVGALRLVTNPFVGPPHWDPTAGALRLGANPFVDPPSWDPACSALPLPGALRPVVEIIVPAVAPDADDLQGSEARLSLQDALREP